MVDVVPLGRVSKQPYLTSLDLPWTVPTPYGGDSKS
jgi:hypothetical protein